MGTAGAGPNPNNLFLKIRNHAILLSRHSTRHPLRGAAPHRKAAKIRRTTICPFFPDKPLKSHKTPKTNPWKKLGKAWNFLGKAWKALEKRRRSLEKLAGAAGRLPLRAPHPISSAKGAPSKHSCPRPIASIARVMRPARPNTASARATRRGLGVAVGEAARAPMPRAAPARFRLRRAAARARRRR